MFFWKNRRLRKELRETLRAVRLALRMREDVAPAADVAAGAAAEAELLRVRREGDWERAAEVCEAGRNAAEKLMPPRPHPQWRENIEVLVVAVGLAMVCRTYFVQPFKIPTGSMQPTLNGVLAAPRLEPHWYERQPMGFVWWLLSGKSHKEVRAKAPGRILDGRTSEGPAYVVGNALHPLRLQQRTEWPGGIDEDRSMVLLKHPGDVVQRGELMAAGEVTAGDHVFVNKMAYNFRLPRRGDIVVFDTDYIPQTPQTRGQITPDTHYIKRLVGLPGETVSIRDRRLVVDGGVVREPAAFERQATDPAYDGYVTRRDALLATGNDAIALADDEFLPFGDNTLSSLDGRYFGGVSCRALVGPAFMVYWPFGPHWGRCR